MRLPRRGLALFAGLALVPLALSGCSTPAEVPATSGATEAIEGDGALTVYAGRSEELIAPLIEQFSAESGIDVTVRYGSTPEINALLLEEGDKTPAQVFLSQDAGALGSLAAGGLVAEIPAALADLIPAGFTSEDASWIGVTGRARVIAYDGESLDASSVPQRIDEVIDPVWNGTLAVAPGNASFQSAVTALRVLEGAEAADAWVAGLAGNAPILTEGNDATLDLVDSGQAQLGLINHYYWFQKAAEVGAENMRAQIAFLPGDAGGIVNVTGAAILTQAAGDPDALAFIEYLVSEAGQQYFVENTFEYPLLPGVDAPEGLPALETLVNEELDLSDLDSLEQTQELLAKHGLI